MFAVMPQQRETPANKPLFLLGCERCKSNRSFVAFIQTLDVGTWDNESEAGASQCQSVTS